MGVERYHFCTTGVLIFLVEETATGRSALCMPPFGVSVSLLFYIVPQVRKASILSVSSHASSTGDNDRKNNSSSQEELYNKGQFRLRHPNSAGGRPRHGPDLRPQYALRTAAVAAAGRSCGVEYFIYFDSKFGAVFTAAATSSPPLALSISALRADSRSRGCFFLLFVCLRACSALGYSLVEVECCCD